jgi:PAS domain S-box-containing protein
MDEKNIPTDSAAAMRRRAEAMLLERSPQAFERLSPEGAKKLLHELQVHQIELEMQNAEMRRLNGEMDATRARYFDLYDMAPVGYVTVGDAGLVLEANFAAARLLGVPRNELVKHPFTRFITAADQDVFYLACRQLLETGAARALELRMRSPGGESFWARLEIAPVVTDSASELRIMLSDISERKHAEEALHDSLQFSNSLIHSMQDGFSIIDPAGVIMDVNPSLCRMTGFSREELVGAGTPHPYWPPEEHERIQAALSETMKGGSRIFELTFMQRNGERFPVTVSPFAVANMDGEIISCAATVRDISERKRAEATLAAERQLLSTLVDLLPTWIFVKDRESRFLLANRACVTNMGAASPQELIGKTDADFYPPEVAERLRLKEEGVLKGIPIVNQEVRKQTAYGEPRILLVNKVPLRDGDGTVTGLVGAAFDITEIKQAEEALRESAEFQRSILNSLPAHVVVLDKAGKILAVNEPWLRFARENGNPAEEKIGVGADYLEVCIPACYVGDPYAQAAVAGVTAVLSGEKPRFTLEYPCDAPGRARWFTMEVVRPTGDIGGAIVAHSEITERKQAEEALRMATQKLRLHFEQTPMAAIEWDMDFRVSRWNPAAQVIFGYSPEEAAGQYASFIVPEEFRGDLDKLWQDLIHRRGGERGSNPNIRKDGAEILCNWYNTPLIDEQGACTGVASLVMDVTARRHAQQLLAWEKSALESIVSADSLGEVLKGLMLGLEEQLPGAVCSVLLLDEDGVHLRLGAAPSLPADYSRALDGLVIGPTAASCGAAAHEQRQIIVSDIASNPLWAGYHELALKHGLHSSWSAPIHGSQGKVLATFAISYREPRHPAPAELELIERAVHVTRIAIERKQAEEKIRQLNVGLEQRVKERTAELLAANASLVDFKHALDEHAIVAITDPDGTITYANDRFCEISKYTREELLGRTHRIVNSGHHPEAFFRELWETISSGRSWKGEVRNRAKDGTIYWVSSTIVPFLGPDGKPQQYIAIRTDISKRKRMEEALHESEERVRLAAEAADIAVWEWDLRTNELNWDARMFEIYGLPPSPDGRAKYQDWTSALLPEELAEQEARLQHTIATCGRGQREFRITRASDHAVRIIQASEMVITGADGMAERVVGINYDSTESKLAEERIRELNTALESRATALEAANKELEAFSYSVSHDLRAPLRAVDGFSRMVLTDYAPKLDDEGRRMLGVIRSEAQRMGRLIDDLLAFSRLGRQPIEAAPVDMQALAQEVCDELLALEPERQVRFELHPLPSALGTQSMIRQVWINLIGNALKFTKEREIAEIEIGVTEDESGGRVYYVKDNGVGFDMRYAEKLFGVFQRLHSQQEFPGTGVGLALVQRIVQRHGGRVWAEAEVNRGATFYFILPN